MVITDLEIYRLKNGFSDIFIHRIMPPIINDLLDEVIDLRARMSRISVITQELTYESSATDIEMIRLLASGC
jgi:hypothetical protein